MRKKMPAAPKPMWTSLDIFRSEKNEDAQTLELSVNCRLDYMASRLRAILMALRSRVTYNHAWWYEMIEVEIVCILRFSYQTTIRSILSLRQRLVP